MQQADKFVLVLSGYEKAPVIAAGVFIFSHDAKRSGNLTFLQSLFNI